MRKHMYDLLDTVEKRRVTKQDFNTLRAARAHRRIYNKVANDPLRYVVVPGPDHPKYKAE